MLFSLDNKSEDGSEESNYENDDNDTNIANEKNEKVKDIFGDEGTTRGTGGDPLLDPFQAHFEVSVFIIVR